MSDLSNHYMAILRNIAPHAPLDLDGLLGAAPTACDDVVAQNVQPFAPSEALWDRPDDEVSYIGIRVSSPIASLEQVAVALSAIAVERKIMPVFISWIGNCGLQRFGLRVEHVSGADDAEKLASEAQLKRLWNLAIIIDAENVSAL